MIICASKEHVKQIAELWRLSFGDGEEYVFKVMDVYLPDTLLYIEQNRVLSMLILMPCGFSAGGASRDARYIYAACTHPEHRDRGYMARLIEFALSAGEYYTLAVPASEGLFDYYGRFGFKKILRGVCITASREELLTACREFKPLKLRGELRPGELRLIREREFSGGAALLWGERHIEFTLWDCLQAGGRVLCFDDEGGKTGYAICENRGDRIKISELCLSGMPAERAVTLLLNEFKAESFEFCLNVEEMPKIFLNGFYSEPKHGIISAGEHDAQAVYMGLTLD